MLFSGLETTQNEFTASAPLWQMNSLATPLTPHPQIPFKSLFETLSGIEIQNKLWCLSTVAVNFIHIAPGGAHNFKVLPTD